MEKRFRKWLLVPALLFHVGIAIVLGILTFALIMMAALLYSFAPSSSPTRPVWSRNSCSIAVILQQPAESRVAAYLSPGWPAGIAAVFGSIEFLRNEPPVPSQNGLRLSNTGNLCQRFPSEALTNLGERGPFRIG